MTENPRQRRKAKNQAMILDAAAHLIVTKGFENVSLRDIAKASDYSPAGLYKHFSSKSAIIQAVHGRENQRLMEKLAEVALDLSPRLRLIELCLLYVQFSLENSIYLVLVNNLTSERKSKQQPVPQNSPYQVINEAVEAWVFDEAVIVDDDYGIEEITYILWALTHGMATLRFKQLKNFEADFDSANRRSLEIFLSGLKLSKPL